MFFILKVVLYIFMIFSTFRIVSWWGTNAFHLG